MKLFLKLDKPQGKKFRPIKSDGLVDYSRPLYTIYPNECPEDIPERDALSILRNNPHLVDQSPLSASPEGDALTRGEALELLDGSQDWQGDFSLKELSNIGAALGADVPTKGISKAAACELIGPVFAEAKGEGA